MKISFLEWAAAQRAAYPRKTLQQSTEKVDLKFVDTWCLQALI
jgi:hypothetical protein